MKITLFRRSLRYRSDSSSFKLYPIFKVPSQLSMKPFICYNKVCGFTSQNSQKNEAAEDSLFRTIDKLKSNKAILEGKLIVNSNKEILLLFSKTSYSEKIWFYLRKSLVLSTIVIFVAKNPLYLIFPASIPIAVFTIWIYFFSFLFKINQRRNIVKEIWLDRNGEEIRVVFSPSLRTTESFKVIQIKSIYKYNLNPSTESLGFEDYPLEGVYGSNKNDTLFKYWRKIYSIDKKYLLISKQPVYSRFDILDKVFEGKKVEFGRNTVFLLENDLSDAVKANAIASVNSNVDDKLTTK